MTKRSPPILLFCSCLSRKLPTLHTFTAATSEWHCSNSEYALPERPSPDLRSKNAASRNCWVRAAALLPARSANCESMCWKNLQAELRDWCKSAANRHPDRTDIVRHWTCKTSSRSLDVL